ncbi:MAG: sensor histidine kinase [Haloarculaceae archaeon]
MPYGGGRAARTPRDGLVDVFDSPTVVADDGVGSPPADRERFVAAGETGSEDGAGLGPAIVRKIAEAHGQGLSATRSDTGVRGSISTASRSVTRTRPAGSLPSSVSPATRHL